jgi:hypothetical protein
MISKLRINFSEEKKLMVSVVHQGWYGRKKEGEGA